MLGTITDPHLPANSIDLIFMVDVYHEFDHPYEMTEAICRALKPGGRTREGSPGLRNPESVARKPHGIVCTR